MNLKRKIGSLLLAMIPAGIVFSAACAEQKIPVSAQVENTVTTPTPPAKPSNNTNQTPLNKAATKPVVSRPAIVSRQEWKAKAAVGEVKQHTLRFITIHHTATLQKKAVDIAKKMQGLQNFSQNEGRLDSGKIKPAWFDVPYHFYIAADGTIAEGRELKFIGDTNTDYDPTGHALIVLEGNFETEQPSAEQQKSLRELATWLAVQYKIPADEIKAHNDYASTACPGKNLKQWLPELREKVGEIIRTAQKP